MNLWDTLTSWVDPTVDFIADALDYEDIANVELIDTYSKGDQLIDDAFGFIKKGATAYSVLRGADSPKGYKKMPAIEGASHRKTRSIKQLTRGGSGASLQTSQATGNPTYANPDVRSAFANLTATGKNVQMNNLLSQFAVAPNIRGGSQTVGLGTTNVKGIAKRPTTATS